jgi:hypothetical protein
MQTQEPKIKGDIALSAETPKTDPAIVAAISEKLDSQPFRWCFLNDEMRWSKKFHSLTWGQVNTRPHCGNYKKDGLTKKQMEIACSPYKPDDEQLYHIHISQEHVLFGYRSADNVFHITINDPEHEFNNL